MLLLISSLAAQGLDLGLVCAAQRHTIFSASSLAILVIFPFLKGCRTMSQRPSLEIFLFRDMPSRQAATEFTGFTGKAISQNVRLLGCCVYKTCNCDDCCCCTRLVAPTKKPLEREKRRNAVYDIDIVYDIAALKPFQGHATQVGSYDRRRI